MTLAAELVERRHSCCVNVCPGVQSTYRWRGKVCHDSEFMLVIKTTEEEFEAVAEALGELHPYELPEILSVPVLRAEERFLGWMSECLEKIPDRFADAVEEEE